MAYSFSGRYCHATGKSKRINPCSEFTHFIFYHFIRSLFLPRTHQHVQFLSEKMMKKEPDQALPITAGLVTTTAFFAMVWCLADGWMTNPGWEAMGLPGLFMDADMRTVVRVRIHFYGPSFRLFVRY
jgi:hypothetical protein